jgi:peptide/nickel transport system substrate-binding protein
MRHDSQASLTRRLPTSRRGVLRGAAAAGAGLAGAWLLACGGDSDSTTTQQFTPGTTNIQQSGSQPKMGHTLRSGSSASYSHLDPHQSTHPASQTNMWHMVGNQLIRANSTTLEIEGDIARSWESPDGTSFIFKLNENVTFQNIPPVSGRRLTSQDVLYSLERTQTNQPSFPRRSNYQVVESMSAPDEQTVSIKLKYPFVPFLFVVGEIYETIVAREVVEQFGDLKLPQSGIGTGPFLADRNSFDKDRGGTFARRPDYWKKDQFGNQLPYLDRVEYTNLGDAAAVFAALSTGKLDSGGVPAENVEEFRKANPSWQYLTVLGLSRDCLLMNCSKPPFNDVRVRQAVSMALDRNLMLQLGRSGLGAVTPAVNPAMDQFALPAAELQTYPGYRAPEDKKGIEQDRAEAKKLLTAAGYANGLDLDVVTSTSGTIYVMIAETSAPQLEPLGIRLKIVGQEWGVLKENEYSGNYQIAATNYYSGPEPDLHLQLYHHTTGGRNYSKLSDPELDNLIDQQRRELDRQKRTQLIQEIQRKQIALAAPAWTVAPGGLSALAPYVRGASEGKISEAYSREHIWFEQ